MSPTDLIRLWIEKFNQADIDGLAEMYAIDAVNEQVVIGKPLNGRAAIRKLLEVDFARAQNGVY